MFTTTSELLSFFLFHIDSHKEIVFALGTSFLRVYLFAVGYSIEILFYKHFSLHTHKVYPILYWFILHLQFTLEFQDTYKTFLNVIINLVDNIFENSWKRKHEIHSYALLLSYTCKIYYLISMRNSKKDSVCVLYCSKLNIF